MTGGHTQGCVLRLRGGGVGEAMPKYMAKVSQCHACVVSVCVSVFVMSLCVCVCSVCVCVCERERNATCLMLT
jgi:hypothetical protein